MKKEPREKKESIEESKENVKAKSDDSGEEKNGEEDSQKNGQKKKGTNYGLLNGCATEALSIYLAPARTHVHVH